MWSCLALSRVALQLRVHFYACFCYVLVQVRVRVNKLSLYLYVMQRAVLRARSIHLFAVCYCFAHGLKGAPLSRLLLRRAACLDTFCARPGHGYQLLLHVATLRRTCAQTRAITRGSRALVSRDILTYKDTCYRPVSGAFTCKCVALAVNWDAFNCSCCCCRAVALVIGACLCSCVALSCGALVLVVVVWHVFGHS